MCLALSTSETTQRVRDGVSVLLILLGGYQNPDEYRGGPVKTHSLQLGPAPVWTGCLVPMEPIKAPDVSATGSNFLALPSLPCVIKIRMFHFDIRSNAAETRSP